MRNALAVAASLAVALGCANGPADADVDALERVTQTLVAPPFVPAHD